MKGGNKETDIPDSSFWSELLGPEFEDLISTDSVRCDGPMQQRTKFDPNIAVNIDKQMSFQHVISLIFLTVENINAARNFCLKVEESEENVVLTVNDRNWSILQCLYSSIKGIGGNKWPDSIFQALYQIGMRKQLFVDLGIDIEEEEKELEEAGKIDERKLMLYNFAENLESAEQEELIGRLQELHPSLQKAKMMETVLLQLLHEVEEIDIICQMLVRCLENMDNAGLYLKKSLQEKECGSKTCPVHALDRTGTYTRGPGICIIINQKIFSKRNSDLEDRHGTDKDRDDLIVTFTLLGVKAEDLKVYNDLTDTQMREKIEAVAKMADTRPDCAWVSVVILSHGRQKLGEDEIMGVNGEGLKKSDILNAFSATKCKNLQKKPKLFWFQACRNKENEAVRETRNIRETGNKIASDNPVPTVDKLPALMDYMVGSATVANASSYRSTEAGSFFIQNLCKVLKKYAEKEPLSRMCLRVTNEVVEFNHRYPSISEFTNVLTKEFWFQVTEESKEMSKKLDKELG